MVKAESLRYSPPYFNFGMVIAPADLMETISGDIEAADNYATSHIEKFFRFQMALTLIIQKYNLPVCACRCVTTTQMIRDSIRDTSRS